MDAYVKNFIGKGKKLKDLEIVRVTINLDDIERFIYQYGSSQFLTFELAKMKNPDKYNRDYTAYVSTREETTDANKQVPEAFVSTVVTASVEQSAPIEEECEFF